jgi:hypothetical protein
VVCVPANEAPWEDLQTVLRTRGPGAHCQCQRYKLRRGESFGGFPAGGRASRLRDRAGVGHPGAPDTGRLVASLGDEPVGWCNVEPRTAYEGLLRNQRVPVPTFRVADLTEVSNPTPRRVVMRVDFTTMPIGASS